MGHWWFRNIIEPGKLPLLLALVSFVLTFAVTRVITRLIQAGKGPFRNISPGGLHIHHVVPGVVLMVIGGFTALAGGRHGYGAGIAAVLFGMGVGLVLDEFALILHLDDVYWSEQGTKSVEIVIVTAALVALILGGALPFGVNELDPEEFHNRFRVVRTVGINFLFALVALFKGKGRSGGDRGVRTVRRAVRGGAAGAAELTLGEAVLPAAPQGPRQGEGPRLPARPALERAAPPGQPRHRRGAELLKGPHS
ncbi:hypothetical protein SRIMM317S_02210 [Streptomyces rimosus subsp. rimosus]